MDMKFWLVEHKKLYRACSKVTASKELSRYKLYVVELQVVRWDGGGTRSARVLHFSTERGMGIISEVKRVEFVSDRMSYIVLRGCLSHTIVLSIHAQQKIKPMM
jgi:hypothetical protein